MRGKRRFPICNEILATEEQITQAQKQPCQKIHQRGKKTHISKRKA
jgi:hypothetical protein